MFYFIDSFEGFMKREVQYRQLKGRYRPNCCKVQKCNFSFQAIGYKCLNAWSNGT